MNVDYLGQRMVFFPLHLYSRNSMYTQTRYHITRCNVIMPTPIAGACSRYTMNHAIVILFSYPFTAPRYFFTATLSPSDRLRHWCLCARLRQPRKPGNRDLHTGWQFRHRNLITSLLDAATSGSPFTTIPGVVSMAPTTALLVLDEWTEW